MKQSLTLSSFFIRRWLSLLSGIGMMVASIMTIDHFFAANYPTSIWEGSFCDISAFFNCDSSAFSEISQISGVPLGYFGLMVGALLSLGALFPSKRFERTNKTIALVNIIGVIVLLAYSVFVLGSLCLMCSGFYFFSALSFFLFWKYGIDRQSPSLIFRYFRPSIKILATFSVVVLLGASGMRKFHDAKKEAQTGGVAARIVSQYFELPEIPLPSILSPFWTVRSTDNFEDAPIRIVEYGDLLCPDCQLLNKQMTRLKKEFAGKINVVFQHFPLEAKCNDVVEKDKHEGACDLAYAASYDPDKFNAIHDEIFGNLVTAKASAEWRSDLLVRFGVQDALTDSTTRSLVHRLIQTGAEYEQTSDDYSFGIRSTPTLIINNRMIIGTFPDAQMRAIFQALIDEAGADSTNRFLENWEE